MQNKNENKTCQNCKKDFTIETDDFNFYEKIKVPPPTWCPDCRFLRRAVFRNERNLFRTTNAITGEPILSLYPAESGYPIYEDTYWISDNWDPYSYGRDFDRSRPFLAQLFELNQEIPHPRADALNMVRSEYSANAVDLKDCYLVFNSNNSENSAYGNGVDYAKNCFDVSHIKNSEKCYESFWLTKCYETFFSSQCENCVSVWFSKNCHGCNNCFGCVNLINKSYCFFNEQLSKEEYFKKVNELELHRFSNLERIIKESEKFWLNFPVKYFTGIKNVSSTGEYVTHSKNVKNSFLVRDGQDLKYVQYCQMDFLRDGMDVTVVGKSEMVYECSISGWDSAQLKFCWECWDGGIDIEYSMFCGRKASHVFGSVAISSGQYVILNKRYSREDFFKLRDEIRNHMDEMPYVDKQGHVYKYGEFFPPEFSPFAYNDTIAPEHFPLSKEEILAFGAKWYEVPKKDYETTVEAMNLVDSIEDASTSILDEIIACAECKRAYRVISPELNFLKSNKIPLPRYCIDCRHEKRISQRNKNIFYHRSCMCDKSGHSHETGKCEEEFETAYSPDSPEIVYCEKCYQQEVY